MAMSRRDLIELGVSYGSGIIAWGNDELAYIEALRAFPEDTSFAEFKQALEVAEEELERRAALAEQQAAQEQEHELEADHAGDGDGDGDADADDDTSEQLPSTSDEDGAGQVEGNLEPADMGEGESEVEESDDDQAGEDDQVDAGETDDLVEMGPVAGAGVQWDIDDGLDDVRAAVRRMRNVLSHLAMSDLYMRSVDMLDALNAGALPPVADIEDFEQRYEQIKEYCATH